MIRFATDYLVEEVVMTVEVRIQLWTPVEEAMAKVLQPELDTAEMEGVNAVAIEVSQTMG